MLRPGMVSRYGGVVPPAFSPADLGSTLKLWLKDAGLSGADNDPISTWSDSSGNANHFTQSTAGNKPTKKTAILNGLPVARFDGSNDYLDGPASSALLSAAGHTLFVVAKVAVFSQLSVSNAAQTPGFLNNVGTYFGHGPDSTAGTGADPTFFASLHDGGHKVVSVATDTSWHRFHARHDAGNLIASIDGGTESSLAAGNIGSLTDATVIGTDNSKTRALNGDIAEVIVCDSALSSGDRTDVMDYLATRFGL